jgi:hypothetical protein
MMKILQVEYRNGDLVDICNLSKVNYRCVLWSHLGMHVLKLERCGHLGIVLYIYFPLL